MRSRRPSGRAQTSIDFLVGVGVFMLAIGFALGVVPSMIDPFTNAQESPLVADRVTSTLVEGMMSEADQPGTLNETCTFAFFDASLGDGDDCPVGYDDDQSDLTDRLGIDSVYSMNVTIQRNVTGGPEPDILCTDGDAVGDCSGLPTKLAIGAPPSNTQSVVSTRRMAFVDGKEVFVVVKLW